MPTDQDVTRCAVPQDPDTTDPATPSPIVITPEDCQDDDDLPFGPPTPDDDDDEDEGPDAAPSSAPCPAIPRTACKPLAQDGAAIYAFDCFEANNLKHPLANGVAVYRENDLIAFGCIVVGLGLYRVFLDRGCPIKVEHEEGRYSWLQCEDEDRQLVNGICSRLASDRNMIFKDGDQEALRLAQFFGLF